MTQVQLVARLAELEEEEKRIRRELGAVRSSTRALKSGSRQGGAGAWVYPHKNPYTGEIDGYRVAYRVEPRAKLEWVSKKHGVPSGIFKSEELADAWAAKFKLRINKKRRTVREGITAFRLHLDARARRGEIALNTPRQTERRLLNLMEPVLDLSIGLLTRTRCAEVYQKLADSGAYEAGSHQKFLRDGRSWGKWVVAQSWLADNPWTPVEAVGKAADHRGDLLHDDEIVAFTQRALDLWREKDDDRYIAPLITLTLSPRPNEVVRIRARDVDRNGHKLWIGGTTEEQNKTAETRRSIRIPDRSSWLRLVLAELKNGKQSDEKLWPHDEDIVNDYSRLICAAIGIPACDAFKLRRTCLNAEHLRERDLDVAILAGHGADPNAKTARRHYLDPSGRPNVAAGHMLTEVVGDDQIKVPPPSNDRSPR